MKRLAVLFSLFILAVIVTADFGIIDPYLRWMTHFGGDKVGHFVLFGLLNFFIIRAFLNRPNADPSRVALTVSLALAILIGLEEWSQSLFPARTMSLDDLAAGYAGVALFGFLAWRVRDKV